MESLLVGAPGNPDVLTTLVGAQIRRGMIDEAVATLGRTEYEDDFLYSRLFHALARAQRGEAEAARADLEAARELFGQSLEVMERARFEAAMNREQVEEDPEYYEGIANLLDEIEALLD